MTFGSVVAAGLPVLVAVAGLAVSATLTTAVIAVVDAPDWSTSLATMIGIDYALLMVMATLDIAGRAVMVAGTTVVATILGVLVVMVASVTLFPALLSFLGRHVDRHRVIATIAGVGLLLALAAPFLDVRFGFPDAGNNPEGASPRLAYDRQKQDFDVGANGRCC